MSTEIRFKLLSLLRWSEKYTRTDMLYIIQGGFWLTLAKGVGLFSSLILAIAMANLITPETFGVYKFVLSTAGLISAFALTGIGTTIIQSVARGFDGSLRSGVASYFRWSIVMVLMSIAVSGYYFANDNTVLGVSFLLAAACNPILIGYSFFSQFLSGKKDFKIQAIFDSIADIAPMLILIGTLFLTKNPVLIIIAYFASGIATNFILYRVTLSRFQPSSTIDPASIPYARHLSLIAIMAKVGENIDKVLVFHYLGATQLAMYAFAQTPVAQLKLLNDIPSRLAVPKLSSQNFTELQRTIPRKVFILMGMMAVIAISYILAAPTLFNLFFSQYTQAIIYTQFMAFSLIFAPVSIFGSSLEAHMKKKELYTSQAILPVTKIGLFLLLLPMYGIWGAIAATLISQCLSFVVYGYLFWQAKSSQVTI